ncbi:MAG: hypothetical protein L0G93_13165 [Acinetobacter sp.]|uniref:hypothetical protein n=1 Tax=Acinetobacter guillouiae TaxID=106649 RepID=UPI00264B4ABD|nr:hypothetical protein [Acinetobacter sp.]
MLIYAFNKRLEKKSIIKISLLNISILKQLQVDPVDSIHQAHIMLNQSYLNVYRN